MENKKKLSMAFIVLMAFTFIFGYYIGTYKERKININNNDKTDKITIDVSGDGLSQRDNLNKVISSEAEILFEVECNNEDGYIIERKRKAQEENICGKNGIQIEQKYSNQRYKLKNITSSQVEVIRKPLKYKPNRYALITEKNIIVICKSDDNGNVFDNEGNIIEKEGTGFNVYNLGVQDINNIINGDSSMQFETIEKLNDGIKDFDIKYEIQE
ncbi:hypothetical protein OW763_04500 [Clostridium aestuarii]|uniref:Uncharacterized protein n=1 Tax=Clostridium aestuarii TaxID=338193 RepID=A0ABT4CXN2_9CLOT|nr:hypothetical protein [Clostridium aestuarii]MCY6483612.1 hypothetical protein [Clostridium aestuarii]